MLHAAAHGPAKQVVEVGLPLGAEHGLLAPEREQLLDEDEAGPEQVEDEPVEMPPATTTAQNITCRSPATS